jgi:hypothetical protein
MKHILFAIIAFLPLSSFAQYDDIAPGWQKKKDRPLIVQKMDELINKVSFEFGCDKSEISYLVTEKHIFYQMKRDYLHFPKYVTIKACGETYYFYSECPQNKYGDPKDWLTCPWVQLPDPEED